VDEAVVVARRRYGRANAWLIAALGVNDETDILPIQIGERGVLSLSFHFLQLFALYPSTTVDTIIMGHNILKSLNSFSVSH
jgi:hypothetical protein